MKEEAFEELIYDWNVVGEVPAYKKGVELDDETLRDGLQSPSVTHPTIEEKIRILHLMEELGINALDIGYAGAGPKAQADALALAKEIVACGLKIEPNCAARTVKEDIMPIIEISQRAGIGVEAAVFIGSSPIRRYAEEWEISKMLRLSEEAVRYAIRNDLPVMYVTEDTTRADPETLRKLYTVAIESGAKRICVCDTVGHATPEGVCNLLTFIKRVVEETGEEVKVDWHGHRDRGLSVPNSLAAIASGADRIHGCALGIGERAGNTPMEILLVNLKLLGIIEQDLSKLPEYCRVVSEACHAPIPFNYPVVGKDAFRTATGVHAAAVMKAEAKGHTWLAERVYSGVPASMFGLAQGIEIGPMSGESNVRYWLKKRGIEPTDSLVRRILREAKEANRILSEEDVIGIIKKCQ
jgi:2-isopropylmalate synthase